MMGQVINLDNSTGGPPAVLTDTGSGGFVSAGYLRDRPARSYLGDDETARFVVTNRKKGIVRDGAGDSERLRPDEGYRTIVVVTDRRVLLLVGRSGGDRSIFLNFADIDAVSVESGLRNGTITITQPDGTRYRVHCSADGIETVADYIDAAAGTWVHVESVTDDVQRRLVAATQHRDDGAYDDAEAEVEIALDRLAEARDRAAAFVREWSADAVLDRLDSVEGRCEATMADIRVGRARMLTDIGERHWRADEYEQAYDAYECAREEYSAVLDADPSRVEDRDHVRQEYERTERLIGQLEESPLRKAIEADRAAADADDPADAADHWERALDHYRTALELDWGEEERRFAGDPDQIRDRLAEVATEAVSARRTAASESRRAGDWYLSADQYEAARGAFETARETFHRAIETARDVYPEAVDHLQTELEAVDQRIERVDAAIAGDPRPDPVSDEADEIDLAPPDDLDETERPDDLRSGSADAPDSGGTDASSGQPDSPDDGSHRSPDGGPDPRHETSPDAAPSLTLDEPVATSGSGPPDSSTPDDEPADVATQLRALDDEAFREIVEDVLSKTGWTIEPTDGSPGDFVASKNRADDQTVVVSVVHRPGGDPVGGDAVASSLECYRATPTADAAMLVTSARTSDDATRRARAEPVRLLDDEFLSAVIEAQGMDGRLDALATVDE